MMQVSKVSIRPTTREGDHGVARPGLSGDGSIAQSTPHLSTTRIRKPHRRNASRYNPQLRIGIVHHEETVRRDLRKTIETMPGCRCVLEAGDGASALARISTTKADIVLLPLWLPDVSGLECARQLRALAPTMRLFAVTESASERDLCWCLRLGFSGLLRKPLSRCELGDALKMAYHGGVYVSAGVHSLFDRASATRIPRETSSPELTKRECEVIDLPRRGLLYKEIAGRLGVSVSTVNNHLANVREKLGVHNRIEVVNQAGLPFP